MKVISTEIPDIKIIEPQTFGDDRGFFMETWNQAKFDIEVASKNIKFVQDNHSKSEKGILRGLHYQKKNTQGKLVRVVSGEVFDVAVDLRQGSKTFGKWFGIFLSDKNKKMLWVPEGFAHGFYVTSNSAEFFYKCTDYYDSSSEVSIKWNDPDIGIKWPLQNNSLPSLSERDKNAIKFKDAPYF